MRGPLGLILPLMGAVAVLATGCRGACCPCPCPCPPVVRCRPVGPAASPPPRTAALAAAQRHGSGLPAVWSHLAATYDADKDGRVVAAEYTRDEAVFKRLDKDEDGALTAADFRGPTTMDAYLTELIWRRLAAAEGEEGQPPFMRGPGPRPPLQVERVKIAFGKADADKDGALAERELLAALQVAQAKPAASVPDVPAGVHEHASLRAVMDANGDGRIVAAELDAWIDTASKPPAPPRPPAPGTPRPPPVKPAKVGEPAPDFTLPALGAADPVTLASFRGKKPVALIFGSYTCPPFRHLARDLRAAIDENLADVQFLFVYIREAHAVDGPAPMPAPDQPLVEEPRTVDERRLVATQCAADLGLDRFPTLVDGIDNAVNRAYAAAPARLYVVDREGVVRYQGGPGPFGLDAKAFADAIRAARAAPPAPR